MRRSPNARPDQSPGILWDVESDISSRECYQIQGNHQEPQFSADVQVLSDAWQVLLEDMFRDRAWSTSILIWSSVKRTRYFTSSVSSSCASYKASHSEAFSLVCLRTKTILAILSPISCTPSARSLRFGASTTTSGDTKRPITLAGARRSRKPKSA